MNNKVEKFIADLEIVALPKLKLVNKLRDIFKKAKPKLEEKFIYGGIGMYLGEELVGGVWVYTKHVSIIFSEGRKLSDSDKILEGGGKYRRHIRIFEERDIEEKKVVDFVEQYFKLKAEV